MKRNVFIKQDPTRETTVSGIYLPASLQDKERENIGTVIKFGPGTEDEPMLYRKGDRVKFSPHAGRDVEYEGEAIKIMVDTDIYCTLNGG